MNKQSTVNAALNATERQTVSAKASRRRLNDKVRAIQEGAELRVPCPSCDGAGACMLCDDNGLVPVSSVTDEPRRCPPRATRVLPMCRVSP